MSAKNSMLLIGSTLGLGSMVLTRLLQVIRQSGAEYETMYLDLELEKAQIFIDRGDLIEGRSVLLTFLENTSNKKDNNHKVGTKVAREEVIWVFIIRII